MSTMANFHAYLIVCWEIFSVNIHGIKSDEVFERITRLCCGINKTRQVLPAVVVATHQTHFLTVQLTL